LPLVARGSNARQYFFARRCYCPVIASPLVRSLPAEFRYPPPPTPAATQARAGTKVDYLSRARRNRFFACPRPHGVPQVNAAAFRTLNSRSLSRIVQATRRLVDDYNTPRALSPDLGLPVRMRWPLPPESVARLAESSDMSRRPTACRNLKRSLISWQDPAVDQPLAILAVILGATSLIATWSSRSNLKWEVHYFTPMLSGRIRLPAATGSSSRNYNWHPLAELSKSTLPCSASEAEPAAKPSASLFFVRTVKQDVSGFRAGNFFKRRR